MLAALSRAEYLRTGDADRPPLPAWSRAFKLVERPYTNIEAREVVIAHGDRPMSPNMPIAPVTLTQPLFGFALGGHPFVANRWVILNIVVPAGSVVEELVGPMETIADASTLYFLTRTIDIHSMVVLDQRAKRIEYVDLAVMPVSDYAYAPGLNELPEGSMRRFQFKVDAGGAIRDAGIPLPVEVRKRAPSMDGDWKLPSLDPLAMGSL